MLWMVVLLLVGLARVPGALAVEPTATLPKLTRIGLTTMEVIDPIPVREMVCGVEAEVSEPHSNEYAARLIHMQS
jgi:hypothetical protein